MTKIYGMMLLCGLFSTVLWGQKGRSNTFYVPSTTVTDLVVSPEGLDADPTQNTSWRFPRRTYSVQGFYISEKVTLREYKAFLAAMRRDSGEAFYLQLLPDSTIGTADQYTQYLTDRAFEKFPVVGVSWINAMRYCVWLNLQENDANATPYCYRLPSKAEWLAANELLGTKKGSDFNKGYADWLITSYFETSFDFIHDLNPDIDADPEKAAKAVRKLFMGNSWRIHFQDPNTYASLFEYRDKGSPFLGFRYVKEPIEKATNAEVLRHLRKKWGY